MADLQWFMTDPNRRCQLPNATSATVPLIPEDTCISGIVIDMADVMLPTAAEPVPHSKRPRGVQGWCVGPDVEADMDVTWQQRKGARKCLRAGLHINNLGKAVNMAGKNLRKVREAVVLSVFCAFVRKLETRVREGDQAGLYKHLQMINLEGKQYLSWAYIEDEDGILLTDVDLICEGWLRWFHTFLNAKSPTLDPNIAEGLDQWSEKIPLGVQPTMHEVTDAIRLLTNGKAVGPDEVFVELIKITFSGDPAMETARYRRLYLKGGRDAAAVENAIITVLHNNKDRRE